MSITYPTTLDTLSNPTSTDLLDNASPSLDHWTQHADANDAIEALEAKVGVNGSAVPSSFDYKLSEVTSSDKAVGKTATQTLTNKTLTSPTITGATATTTTVNGVTLDNTQGSSVFLRGDGTYAAATAGDASYSAKGSVQGLTDAATSGLTIAAGVISVNDGTTANKIVKLNGSAQLPAVDGSLLTGITPLYKNGTTTKNVAEASTTQTIAHGLGKTPKYVRFTYVAAGGTGTLLGGTGVYNGTTVSNVYNYTNTSPTTYNIGTSSTNVISWDSSGGGTSLTQVAVPTFDSTNITLTWTRSASAPTGTYTILWEAFA